jgi:hypothetical protein
MIEEAGRIPGHTAVNIVVLIERKKIGITRMVKIIEPACSWEVIHHQAPMFRLVFHFIFLHTHSGHGLLDYLISGYVEEIEPNSDRYAYGGWGLSEPAHIIRRDPFEF